jgi:hypothetical protein
MRLHTLKPYALIGLAWGAWLYLVWGPNAAPDGEITLEVPREDDGRKQSTSAVSMESRSGAGMEIHGAVAEELGKERVTWQQDDRVNYLCRGVWKGRRLPRRHRHILETARIQVADAERY